MITNFEQFKEKYFSKENNEYTYDFIDNLKHEERESLKQEIMKWSDNHFMVAYDVLQSYGMKVPQAIVKEIALSDLVIAFEIYTGGVRDTCQSSILANSVLRKINMSSWPTYGDGEKAYENFIETLKIEAPKFGIIVEQE